MAGGRVSAPGGGSFDPASLSLTGWWRISSTEYDGSPWVGTASAGASLGRDLSEATNPPAVGAALNGLNTASFDGTNDRLTSATNLSSYISAAAYSVVALIDIAAISGVSIDATAYANEAIIADTGAFFGMHMSSEAVGGGNRLQLYHWDGAAKTLGKLFTPGPFVLVQWKYDGTNILGRLDSGSWTSTAAGNVSTLTGTIRVGNNNGVAFYNGLLAELMITNTTLSDATFNQIKAYVNRRYALAL